MIEFKKYKCYSVTQIKKGSWVVLFDRWDKLQDIESDFCFLVLDTFTHVDGNFSETMLKILVLDEICTSAISYLISKINSGDITIEEIC